MITHHRACRRKIVGWDHNPPDPFPGFGGKVGLGQDCAQLDDDAWLVVFSAGYWHISMATPIVAPSECIEKWRTNGLNSEIDAPQGGRVLAVRSTDGGVSWSRPWTILNGRWEDNPVGLSKLRDGTLLLFVDNQASWYALDKAPDGHLPVNSRIGVMRSEDGGESWSEPFWLEMPYPYYQRAYAQALELPDGAVLYPTYCAATRHGPLYGAIHRSDDAGKTWRVVSTIERADGKDLDEPSLTRLRDGRIMLLARLDAAVFYSEDDAVTWTLSHRAPLAPMKAHRTAVLADGTVVCWMTSHGCLRVSWTTDGGRTWHVGADGKPFVLDPQCYGYPGGCVLADETVNVVYYDGANRQQRTNVWEIRFRIDPTREAMQILPALGAPGEARPGAEGGNAGKEELDLDAM